MLRGNMEHIIVYERKVRCISRTVFEVFKQKGANALELLRYAYMSEIGFFT
jgi:hypothetical protein